MAYKKGLFNDWVPKKVGLAAMIIILIPLLTVNGLYTSNIADLVGSLGNMTEDITFASYASSVGMLAVFPIMVRLKQYLKSRNILLMSLLTLVIISLICANTTSTAVLIIGNFLLGGIKMLGMIEIIIPMMFMISKTGDRPTFYAVFYPVSMIAGQASGYLTAHLAYTYNWQYVYYFSIPLLLIAIALVILLFHAERSARKVPLFQVDWLSMGLFSSLLMLINYIFVYGKFEDWFHSVHIQAAVIAVPILLIWFIKRQLYAKRPYLSFEVLKHKNVRIGILFIVLFQFLFSSGSVQSAFAASIMKLDVEHNTALNLWMLPGIILGAVVCFFWFKYKKGYKGIILMGFAALTMYHLLLYFTFYPGAEMQDFYLPLFLKGVGMITLYIGIGLLVVNNLKVNQILSGSVLLIIFRSGIAPTAFTSMYSNMLYSEQLQNTTELANNMDALNPLVTARYGATVQGALAQGNSIEAAQSLAARSLSGTVQLQSLMTSAKEIFGYVTIAGIIILIFIILIRIQPINKRKIVNWRRKFRGEDTLQVSLS